VAGLAARGGRDGRRTFRRRFDECGFDEKQIEFIWKLIFNVADYQMHLLMDFIEFMTRYTGCASRCSRVATVGGRSLTSRPSRSCKT
jgi:hypothetical protein